MLIDVLSRSCYLCACALVSLVWLWSVAPVCSNPKCSSYPVLGMEMLAILRHVVVLCYVTNVNWYVEWRLAHFLELIRWVFSASYYALDKACSLATRKLLFVVLFPVFYPTAHCTALFMWGGDAFWCQKFALFPFVVLAFLEVLRNTSLVQLTMQAWSLFCCKAIKVYLEFETSKGVCAFHLALVKIKRATVAYMLLGSTHPCKQHLEACVL